MIRKSAIFALLAAFAVLMGVAGLTSAQGTDKTDKKIPAKDKKAVLADLDAALKSPGPAIENKGNIDLVTKYYDKLAEALGESEE